MEELPPFSTLFPRLSSSRVEITSDHDPNYNCLAWALHDTTIKWGAFPGYRWPKSDDIPYDDRVVSLVRLLKLEFDFEQCDDGSVEEGFEKVAIFASGAWWDHIARQLPNGRWTSKIGNREDISHESPEDLEGDEYGYIVCYLKRSIEG